VAARTRGRDPRAQPAATATRTNGGAAWHAPPAVLTAQADDEPEPASHPSPLPFTAPWSYELRYPCDPRAPGIARLTLRAVLQAHGLTELADRAELLTSELTTNSVRHTRGPASVRLHWLDPVLRVSVWDMSPDLPPLGPRSVASPDAFTGRGLLILDVLADRWGGCGTGEGPYGPAGKTVWFELALPPDPPTGGPVSAPAA
jgi:anti-sigma regulatory factor (Ser/Thr protein kinase)